MADQLALPQFEAGAMENWGLVIYDADGFLSDQRSQITEQERSQAEVEAHELAHQVEIFSNIFKFFSTKITEQQVNFSGSEIS